MPINITANHPTVCSATYKERKPSVVTRGTGHVRLGLVMVRAVAQMHGGTVFAHSEQGVNRIGMRLPLTQASS